MLQSLVTPAPLAYRRLGCVGDAVRTGSRSRRCRRAWAPHLAATREVVCEAIHGVARHDTAVILGSGRLDDVPLTMLAKSFARVVLVDVVHPFAARRRARPYRNVEMITADLSGSFSLVLSRGSDLEAPLPPICSERSTNLVVSANLLSQLPLRPVERLEASSRGYGRWRPDDGDDLGREIVARHLEALAALPARVCLVTDLDQVEEDREGHVLDRLDLLYSTTLGEPERGWNWELAPFGEIARDRRLLHEVAGFSDWRP